MAALEILALDTATPQIEAPQTGDTYSAPRAVAIAPESLTGASATTSLDIAQTWNTTGTPTAVKLNITDTASNAASLLIDLQVGGTSKFSVTKAGTTTFSGNLQVANDLTLVRDAADILAQRRTTNAQTFRVYNTYTDASNYERGVFSWASNDLKIGVENAGTGASSRQLHIYSGGLLRFYTNGTHRWNFDASGNFVAAADNTYDIGASGANRPRIGYFGTRVDAPTIRTNTAYTVATLPAAGTAGRRAYVTDATAPTWLGALTGGGAVVCPVFDNGTAWVAG